MALGSAYYIFADMSLLSWHRITPYLHLTSMEFPPYYHEIKELANVEGKCYFG